MAGAGAAARCDGPAYGLAVDPQEVAKLMQAITAMVSHDPAKLIDEQLKSVVLTATGKKGLALRWCWLSMAP